MTSERALFSGPFETTLPTLTDDVRTQCFNYCVCGCKTQKYLWLIICGREGRSDGETDIHKPEIVKKRYNLSLPGRTEYTNDSNHITIQDKSLAKRVKLLEPRHSFLSNISAFRKTYCRSSMFIMAFKTPNSSRSPVLYNMA